MGGISPFDLESMMDVDLEVHHHESLKPARGGGGADVSCGSATRRSIRAIAAYRSSSNTCTGRAACRRASASSPPAARPASKDAVAATPAAPARHRGRGTESALRGPRPGVYRGRPGQSMMLPAMTYPSRVNPGNPAVDPEAIEQLRFLEDEDQPNVVAELVLLFVEHTPPKIAAIRDGITQGDAGAVKRAAHSLKGSSANVGATGMQHVCEQIEHAAAGGDLGPAKELLPLLEQEVAVVVEALQAGALISCARRAAAAQPRQPAQSPRFSGSCKALPAGSARSRRRRCRLRRSPSDTSRACRPRAS